MDYREVVKKITAEYGKEVLKKKLEEYAHCRNCDFTAPHDKFPESIPDEKFCPECLSWGDIINAAQAEDPDD
ncbi:MAG: hypothetical protein Q8O83_00670 [bacterium]|nr:hypothetical protein [bacterium]